MIDENKIKVEVDNSIAVNLKESATPTNTYFCKYCNRKLFYKEQDKETGKHIWQCISCIIEVIPDNELTKKATHFEIPEGSDPNIDKDIPIAVIDDPNKSLSETTYKKQKLPPSFEVLKKSGFNFTSYEER